MAKNIPTHQKSLTFYAISDIHFDPFIGCHLKKYCSTGSELSKAPVKKWDEILSKNFQQKSPLYRLKKDTNHNLLLKTMRNLSDHIQRQKPAFVVLTGDFLGHGLKENYLAYFKTKRGYERFVRKIFSYLVIKLHSTFPPDTPIFFVMGNNDGYLGDYVHNANNEFFKDIASQWPTLKKQFESSDFNKVIFIQMGSYAVNYSHNLKLIILNSNLFYRKTEGKNRKKYANKTLKWLRIQLHTAESNNQKVLIFYHIPYGVHPFKKMLSRNKATLWDLNIHNDFYRIIKQYQNTIRGIIHGHFHQKFLMRIHTDRLTPIKQHLVNSISPIFGNQPSFTIFTLTKGHLTYKQIPI